MAASYSAAVFLVTLTFSKHAFTNPDTLSVRYLRDPVRRMEEQSLTLKCTVEYDENHCLGLRTSWCLAGHECQPLINPDLGLIRLNESRMPDKPGFRQRGVFITFNRLLLSDSGLYQCVGKCADPGPSAMGHLINLTVTEKKPKSDMDDLPNNGMNRSDRGSTEIILLILSGFILSWI